MSDTLWAHAALPTQIRWRSWRVIRNPCHVHIKKAHPQYSPSPALDATILAQTWHFRPAGQLGLIRYFCVRPATSLRLRSTAPQPRAVLPLPYACPSGSHPQGSLLIMAMPAIFATGISTEWGPQRTGTELEAKHSSTGQAEAMPRKPQVCTPPAMKGVSIHPHLRIQYVHNLRPPFRETGTLPKTM
jgi:hypothetical protein